MSASLTRHDENGLIVPANSLVGHEAPDIRPTRLLAGTGIFIGG